MLYIVGFGPGGYETMTVEAVRALEDSDLIVGYTTYVDLIVPGSGKGISGNGYEAGKGAVSSCHTKGRGRQKGGAGMQR